MGIFFVPAGDGGRLSMILECGKYFYIELSKLLYKYNVKHPFEKCIYLLLHIFVKMNNEIWTKWFMYI